MCDHRIRSCFKILPLPALAILLVSYWVLHSVHVEGQVSQKSKLRDLQEQRLATLSEVASLTNQKYQNGEVSSEELQSAIRARDEAELDLCTSNMERVALLEKLVADAKGVEEQDAKLVANHLLAETSFLKARADRLQQEILLEQARTK